MPNYPQPWRAPAARVTPGRPAFSRPGPQLTPHLPSVSLLVILTAQLMLVLEHHGQRRLPHIQQSLGFSTSGLSWVLNAYILTFGGFLLLGARPVDIRPASCVPARDRDLRGQLPVRWPRRERVGLLAARAVQGTVAALAAPSARSLLTTAFPEGEQASPSGCTPPCRRRWHDRTGHGGAADRAGLLALGDVRQRSHRGRAVWLLGRSSSSRAERQHGHFDLTGALTCTIGVTGVGSGLSRPAPWVGRVPSVAALVSTRSSWRTSSDHEGRVGGAHPAAPAAGACHPQLRQRGTGPFTPGSTAPSTHGPFPAGRPGVHPPARRGGVRAHSGMVPGLAAHGAASFFVACPRRSVMVMGSTIAIAGLLLATSGGPGRPTPRSWSPRAHRCGERTTLVPLTSASLADVEPEIAGPPRAREVSPQLGAAVGLAVLVTGLQLAHGPRPARGGEDDDLRGARPDGVFWVLNRSSPMGALPTTVALGVDVQRRRRQPRRAGLRACDRAAHRAMVSPPWRTLRRRRGRDERDVSGCAPAAAGLRVSQIRLTHAGLEGQKR